MRYTHSEPILSLIAEPPGAIRRLGTYAAASVVCVAVPSASIRSRAALGTSSRLPRRTVGNSPRRASSSRAEASPDAKDFRRFLDSEGQCHHIHCVLLLTLRGYVMPPCVDVYCVPEKGLVRHTHLKEQPLRKRVARELGLDAVPDAAWKAARDLDSVSAALRGGEEEIGDLVTEVRRFVEVGREIAAQWTRPGSVPIGRKADYMIEPRFNRRESLRIDTLSAYCAKVATQDHLVNRYRETVLRGRTLSEEEAVRFIESPAAQLVTPYEFDKWGIDPVDHNDDSEEPTADPSTRAVFRAIHVSSPDGVKTKDQMRRLTYDHVPLPYQHPDRQVMVQHVPCMAGIGAPSTLHNRSEPNGCLSVARRSGNHVRALQYCSPDRRFGSRHLVRIGSRRNTTHNYDDRGGMGNR